MIRSGSDFRSSTRTSKPYLLSSTGSAPGASMAVGSQSWYFRSSPSRRRRFRSSRTIGWTWPYPAGTMRGPPGLPARHRSGARAWSRPPGGLPGPARSTGRRGRPPTPPHPPSGSPRSARGTPLSSSRDAASRPGAPGPAARSTAAWWSARAAASGPPGRRSCPGSARRKGPGSPDRCPPEGPPGHRAGRPPGSPGRRAPPEASRSPRSAAARSSRRTGCRRSASNWNRSEWPPSWAARTDRSWAIRLIVVSACSRSQTTWGVSNPSCRLAAGFFGSSPAPCPPGGRDPDQPGGNHDRDHAARSTHRLETSKYSGQTIRGRTVQGTGQASGPILEGPTGKAPRTPGLRPGILTRMP